MWKKLTDWIRRMFGSMGAGRGGGGGGTLAPDTTAPTITSGNAFSVNENTVLTRTATSNETVTWTKGGAGAAQVTLNAGTGEWSLAAQDYETTTSVVFTLTATDASANSSAPQTITVTINDVADVAPEITSGGAFSTAENAALNETATASGTAPIAWSKSGADAGLITLNASTGAWSLPAQDYETRTSVSFSLTATNAYGADTEAVVVTITNILDAATLSTLTGSLSVNENSTNGTVVGTPAGYTGGSTKSLSDSAGGRFAINATTGQITVANGTLLDYETATTHNITIVETLADSPNSPNSTALAVAVNDVGESGIALSASSLTRTSGVSTYPPTASFTRPIDWADSPAMYGVMQRTQDVTFATGVTEKELQILAATTTYDFDLDTIASGVWYFKLGAYNGIRPGSLNWSNIQGVGDAVAPVITSTNTASGTQFVAGTKALTADKAVTWAIVGGANQDQFSISGSTLSWLAQSTAGTLLVDIQATSYFGVVSTTQTITNTIAANTPSAFTFTDITGATQSTVYTSNTITVAGIVGGASLPVTITGGTYSKNGGAYTSVAGTAVNGDTFAVRQTSSASYLTAGNTVLTIASTSDTYTVTTMADPSLLGFTVGPAVGANVAFGSSSYAFTNQSFGTGMAVVVVGAGGRAITSVDDGGVAMTLVAQSSAGEPQVSIWRGASTAGTRTITVTGTAALSLVSMTPYTVDGSNRAASDTDVLAFGFRGDPQALPSITVPANGLGIAALVNTNSTVDYTWSNATVRSQVDVTGDHQQTTATFIATVAPEATSGLGFDGTAMVGATWAP